MDYKEKLLEERYQYEKECEEMEYYIEDLGYHDDLPGALVDARLNDVYEFNLAVEVWGY